MRPIKFRGRVPENYHHYGGQIVYGSLVTYPENAPWNQGYPNWIVPLDDRRSFPVDPESVAQFVGYDRDGNEVYEGDKILIDDAGDDEFFATCLPVGVNHWGGCFLHGGNFIFTKEFSLKEACQNPWNALQEIDNLIERHVEEATK